MRVCVLGCCFALTLPLFGYLLRHHLHRLLSGFNTKSKTKLSYKENVLELIGNTPLLKLNSLSEETGCLILAKCEFMNPGGSVKDRVAKEIILEAERQGELNETKNTVVEATAGSTGIALALVSNVKKYKLELYAPDLISKEKVDILRSMGATVHVVPIVPKSDPNNFMHHAQRRCIMDNKTCFYANQFQNPANFNAHYTTTGPEIWHQTGGNIDGLVLSAGTGGTLAGVSKYLKEQKPDIQVYVVDPPGSGLFRYYTEGTLYSEQDAMLVQPLEPRSFYEGIGINIQTKNFSSARVDGVFQGTESEGVEMAHYLLKKEGLLVGGSSALNCVGAVKLARKLGKGKIIVTVLCDSGSRYLSKLFNPTWLAEKDLTPSAVSLDFVVKEE